MGKKMGMHRLLACALAAALTLGGVATTLAAPAVAEAATEVMPDGKTAEVLTLEGGSTEPVKITRSGRYVLKTVEGEVTPTMGYTIDVPGKYGWVQIYIDGSVSVSTDEKYWDRDDKLRWLFGIKQASSVEFIGVNNPSVSFARSATYLNSGFLTDRYYENGSIKNAEGDVSINIDRYESGDENDTAKFLSLYYLRSNGQHASAIALGNTEGALKFEANKLRIYRYYGYMYGQLGRRSEYPVPIRLARRGYTDSAGNTHALTATFNNCEVYSTLAPVNGAVSIEGNGSPIAVADSDNAAKLTTTFNNCTFSAYYDEGIRQTTKGYTTLEESNENEKTTDATKFAVAGVMGVTNATVNLNSCSMRNFHSTRSISSECTMTVDAINVGRSARCNIKDSNISRYAAKGNTCLVYVGGTLTLDGVTNLASFWKNSHAGDKDDGDNYTDADIATGTAKSVYVPKKKSEDDAIPALNIASGFSVRGGYGDHVWISIEETDDENSQLPRVLGTCKSSKIEGVVPDGTVDSDLSPGVEVGSEPYQIRNIDGKLVFRNSIHEHAWQIEKDGFGIKGACTGTYHNSECEYGTDSDGKPNGFKTATYKLAMTSEAPDGQECFVYDGGPITISMDDKSKSELADMDVTQGDITWYSCRTKADAEVFENGTELSSAPSDPGNYYVAAEFKIKRSSGYTSTLTVKQAFEIVPRVFSENDGKVTFTLKDGGKGAGTYLYSGKSFSPVIESAEFVSASGEAIKLVEGTDYTIDKRGNGEYAYAQTEPGVYKLTVKGKGKFNGSLDLTWEIVDAGRFEVAALGYTGVYDGEEHGIVVTVKNDPAPTDMKIEYKTSDSSDWVSENPAFKNAVTRTVWYRVTASDYLTATGKATVEIFKADQDAPTGLVGNDWTTCNSRDGSISGVTKAMEYCYGSDKTYTKIKVDGSLSGLSSTGTYRIRYAADNNHSASADTEVKISRGSHAMADNAKWKPGDPGQHYKICKYCGKAIEYDGCKWVYEVITPATPEADGTRQRVCRICGGKDYYTGVESYTYIDTYPPTIYDLWEDGDYCESVSFDVIDDRDGELTVTDNGRELKAGKDGMYTIKAAKDDAGTAHVIVATDEAGNAATKNIKMYAEHDYEWAIDKQPTVSEAGSKHGTCSRCKQETGAVEIPAMTVKGYSGEYDGEAHSVDSGNLPEGSSVEYSVDGGSCWSNDVPSITNVGVQEVMFRVTVEGAAVEGKVTLKVTARKITVRPIDTSKTYGDSDPVLGYSVTKGSLVKGENLEKISVLRDGRRDVGTEPMKAVQPEGANPNYDITFEPGTFTVEKCVLTVTWGTTEFVYDGTEKVPAVALGNLAYDDAIEATVEGAAKKAGSHTATVAGIKGDKAGNYALPKDGLACGFTIKKAPKGAPVIQAEAETISGKGDGKITGVDASMEWRAKDTADYAVVPAGTTELTDLASNTYCVRYAATDNHEASADTEVAIAAGRKLKVVLPDQMAGYGLSSNKKNGFDWLDSVTLSFWLEDGYYKQDSFALKVNGVDVALNEYGDAVVDNAKDDFVVTVEGVAKHEAVNDTWEHDENSHWHACTCGDVIDKAEHTFEWVVDKKPSATEKGSKHQKCSVCGYEKTESVEIPAASVTGYFGEYDGEFHTVDESNLPQGVKAQYSTDGGKTWAAEAPQIKNVGKLTLKYKATVDGSDVEGDAALEVAPRKITIRPNDASKVYGDSDPVLDYRVAKGSLVKGERLEKISVLRDGRRDAGVESMKAVQPEGANANYSITFEPGTFTVEQRVLTVTWGTNGFVYDGTEKVPAVTLGNLAYDDAIEATVEGPRVEANAAGGHYTATITGLTGDKAGNYALPTDGLTCDFTIKNATQGAPVVQAEAETVSGKHDGAILGVDASMEYRAEGEREYKAVKAGVSKLENLAPGTYCVRYQAKANHDVSPDTAVTVVAGRKLAVSLPKDQAGYTLTASATELDWHQAATLKFNLDSQYFATDDFAVKINDKVIELATDGTYTLSATEDDVIVTVEGILKHEPDGSGWKSDADGHWHICRCGDKIDEAKHDFAWIVDEPATASSKGSKHQECTVCGRKGKTAEIDMLPPTIVEGAGQKMTVGANKDLAFRSDAPIDLFVKVTVDGEELESDCYELTEGSTIVTLKADYLATLKAGEHELAVESETGVATTTFTIEEPKAPVANPSGTTTTTAVTTTVKKKAHKKQAEKDALAATGDAAFTKIAICVATGAVLVFAGVILSRKRS